MGWKDKQVSLGESELDQKLDWNQNSTTYIYSLFTFMCIMSLKQVINSSMKFGWFKSSEIIP